MRWLALMLMAVLLRPMAAFCDDFSGKMEPYTDTYNGYKIMIPVESKQTMKGYSTNWDGPMVNGSTVTIFVNCTEMKRVSSKLMFDVNLKKYKEDRSYTDVVALPPVKLGKSLVYAFRCSEAGHRPGTTDPKDASEIHRWHMFVFGNERSYTCVFACNYGAFQEKLVQPTFNQVIKSFSLVPAKL